MTDDARLTKYKVEMWDNYPQLHYHSVRASCVSMSGFQAVIIRWLLPVLLSSPLSVYAFDMTQPKPVVVTHKVVGDTLFILDEEPFKNPRKEYMNDKETTVYQARLKQAISRKNPVTDAQAAVVNNQLYLLADVSRVYIEPPRIYRWTPRPIHPFRMPSRTSISPIFGLTQMDSQEKSRLTSVCPVRLMEGNLDNSLGSPVSKLYQPYGLAWNKTMLPFCRAKAKQTYPRETALWEAEMRWNKNALTLSPHYLFTLQANTLSQGQALEVAFTNKGFRLTRRQTNTPLPTNNYRDLFSVIHTAIGNKAARLEVKYHERYGFPMSILIQQKSGMLVETYTVSDFQLLPP